MKKTEVEAQNTIKLLTKQAETLKSKGHGHLANQNERIIKRLQHRIKAGKYTKKES